MFIESFKVESPNVKYTENEIHSVYNYDTTELVHENRNGTYQWIVKPKTVKYEFKTDIHVPKLGFAPKSSSVFFIFRKKKEKERHFQDLFFTYFSGSALSFWISFSFLCFRISYSQIIVFHFRRVMLVGWGGNNGSTLTAGVIANREWVPSLFIIILFQNQNQSYVIGGYDCAFLNMQKQNMLYLNMIDLDRIYIKLISKMWVLNNLSEESPGPPRTKCNKPIILAHWPKPQRFVLGLSMERRSTLLSRACSQWYPNFLSFNHCN